MADIATRSYRFSAAFGFVRARAQVEPHGADHADGVQIGERPHVRRNQHDDDGRNAPTTNGITGMPQRLSPPNVRGSSLSRDIMN